MQRRMEAANALVGRETCMIVVDDTLQTLVVYLNMEADKGSKDAVMVVFENGVEAIVVGFAGGLTGGGGSGILEIYFQKVKKMEPAIKYEGKDAGQG